METVCEDWSPSGSIVNYPEQRRLCWRSMVTTRDTFQRENSVNRPSGDTATPRTRAALTSCSDHTAVQEPSTPSLSLQHTHSARDTHIPQLRGAPGVCVCVCKPKRLLCSHLGRYNEHKHTHTHTHLVSHHLVKRCHSDEVFK